AIALIIDGAQAHLVTAQVDAPLQAPGPALRAGTGRPQPAVTELARAAVGPLQPQTAGGAAQAARRAHRPAPDNWAMAIRTALRTSGSASPSASRKAGSASGSASSPRASAASLRRLLMLWPSNSIRAGAAAAKRNLPSARAARRRT